MSNMMDRSFLVSVWQLLFRPMEMRSLKLLMALMLELLVFFLRLVKITLINFSSGVAQQAKEIKMPLVSSVMSSLVLEDAMTLDSQKLALNV
jgi:hypothetical protein